MSPGEKKVFRNWQFETYSGDNKTSKFYDDRIINIKYNYPGTIYIYYDTYYNVTVESNKEDLGFSLWAIENSNVSLPQLRIPILYGLGGEWVGEVTGNKSVLGTNSIENVDGGQIGWGPSQIPVLCLSSLIPGGERTDGSFYLSRQGHLGQWAQVGILQPVGCVLTILTFGAGWPGRTGWARRPTPPIQTIQAIFPSLPLNPSRPR